MISNDSTRRDRGRAAFLAAIVVLSLVAMSVAFASGAIADPNDVNDGVVHLSDGDRLYQGQYGIVDDSIVTGSHVDLSDSESEWLVELTVYSGDSDGFSDAAADFGISADRIEAEHTGGDFVVVDSTNLASNSHYIGDADDFEFEVSIQDVDATFADETVANAGGSASETTLDVDSARANFHANVSADGLGADDLEEIFGDESSTDVVAVDADEAVITLQARGTFDVSFSDTDAGLYEFDIDVTDTTAAETVSIEVVDGRIDRRFTDDAVGAQGELIDIPVELEYTSEGAIVLGDEDAVGFETAVEFADESGEHDEVVLQYNTHSHTQEADHGWSVHPDYADDVTIEDTWRLHDPLTDPIEPAEYELAIGEEFTGSALTHPTDGAWFVVKPFAASGDLSLRTAPLGSDLDDREAYRSASVTETETVADGDLLVGAVADLGTTGAVADALANGAADGEDLQPVLDELGIVVEIEQAETPLNVDQVPVWTTDGSASGSHVHELNLTAIDVETYDGSELRFVVEYGDADERLAVGEPYELTFEITEASPYVDEDETHLDDLEFTVEKPTLEWDDDATAVPIGEAAAVTGTTNVAPGSRIDTHAFARGEFRISSAADVADDGTFTATYDFSNEGTGTSFDLTATHASVDAFEAIDGEYADSLHDEIEAELAGAAVAGETGIRVDVDVPSEVAVGDAATLEVTVTNRDDASAETAYEVVIGSETVDERTLELEAGEEFTESYDVDTGVAGDVDWSVTAVDETSGTLIVSEAVVDEDDADDADDTPAFGVVVALVAVLIAVTLVLVRRD